MKYIKLTHEDLVYLKKMRSELRANVIERSPDILKKILNTIPTRLRSKLSMIRTRSNHGMSVLETVEIFLDELETNYRFVPDPHFIIAELIYDAENKYSSNKRAE